uniref:Heterogeneous nuclear ribonucleoprotein K n=1 Tax=Schistocephalus solidus TaxID=70667 RepID=A0A0X3NTI2_SCHSO
MCALGHLQYSVRLHIPDSRGPERVFYLEGEISSICGCLKDLAPQFMDVLSAKDSDQRLFNGRDEDGQEQNVDPEKLIDLRILIHQSQVGSVIGKKGDRIKELKNDNNMHLIKIYQELAPCSTDRVVQLIGEPEGVASCVGGIMETLEASPIRGPRNDYDANYWDQGSAPYPSGSDRWSAPYYDAPPPPPPPGYVPSRGYDSRPPSHFRERSYERKGPSQYR